MAIAYINSYRKDYFFQLQDDSIDASTFAVNRPESSDNESDPGTYEEQRIKNIAARKAKFDELQLKVG